MHVIIYCDPFVLLLVLFYCVHCFEMSHSLRLIRFDNNFVILSPRISSAVSGSVRRPSRGKGHELSSILRLTKGNSKAIRTLVAHAVNNTEPTQYDRNGRMFILKQNPYGINLLNRKISNS